MRGANHRSDTSPSRQQEALSEARLRLCLVGIGFCLAFVVVAVRLVDLTLLRGKALTQTATIDDEQVKLHSDRPLRASILDRNGELVATTLKMASVYADTTLVTDSAKLARDIVAVLPQLTLEDVRKKLSSGKKFVWIARNISPRQEYQLNALGDPALAFQEEDRRIYPANNLISHIAGYTDVDGKGIAGIEKQFNRQLAEGETPLRLTIDLRLQHILHRELSRGLKHFEAIGAAGIILDAQNGDVLAMVSLPDFDPHQPGKAKPEARFNRATLGVYEMGSTMKLFPVAAALEEKKTHMGSVYDTTQPIKFGRFTISDYHGKKRLMTLPEVFIHSSNIGTAKIALALGDDMRRFYERLGFFTPVGIELPERGRPLAPPNWRDVNLVTASFGHGIAVSALHLAQSAASLTNGGHKVSATLVLKDKKDQAVKEQVVSEKTSLQIRQLLDLVVRAGTGSKAMVEGYGVGGKTGTAEKATGGKYAEHSLLSSFIGVYPIANPRYVVLAMLDEPKPQADTSGYATAGWTAAPIVGRVVAQMAPLYGILPDFDGAPLSKNLFVYLKDKPEEKSLATLDSDR
jgi:cell division protein FtsI (penicillin-binding protein 3)